MIPRRSRKSRAIPNRPSSKNRVRRSG
jgi:hypothetical protein